MCPLGYDKRCDNKEEALTGYIVVQESWECCHVVGFIQIGLLPVRQCVERALFCTYSVICWHETQE